MRFAPNLRFFRRSATQVQEPDPADLGTAFGMEASLAPMDDMQYGVRQYELESQQTAAAPPPESPLAWLSRR